MLGSPIPYLQEENHDPSFWAFTLVHNANSALIMKAPTLAPKTPKVRYQPVLLFHLVAPTGPRTAGGARTGQGAGSGAKVGVLIPKVSDRK